MSNSIENIKSYLSDFKEYNEDLITDNHISRFEITGDLLDTTTDTSINLGNDNQENPKTFKIQQILNNLRSSTGDVDNNTTIDFENDGIMYFTINDSTGSAGTTHYNIMELFTKDAHSVYVDPNEISLGNEDSYFDYYMRYKLLKLTINRNSGITKSIYSTEFRAYQDSTKIKDLYTFISSLKNLTESELSHISYIHILKCFKYYYQMALIIMNHAFIYKIKTDLASEATTLHAGVVRVQTNIKDLIKALVIEYAKSPSVEKKTAIQNLINLGHINTTGYTYTFILQPQEVGTQSQTYVTTSIYNRIKSEIDLIYDEFSSIRTRFTKGDNPNAAVDEKGTFKEIFSCHIYFGNIRQHIDDISSAEATDATAKVIIENSDVLKYRTYIDALKSFFNSIYELFDSSKALNDRISAIENIEKYIDSSNTGNTENSNLMGIKTTLVGSYNDEESIADQINSMEPIELTNAKNIINTTLDGTGSPTHIVLNIDSSSADNSDFDDHLGLTYYETEEITELDMRKVSDKKYYIADNVSNINIKGLSSHNPAGDTIGTLTDVKYYTKTTGPGGFQPVSDNDITSVAVPRADNGINVVYIKITRTVSVPVPGDSAGSTIPEEQSYLYITLRLKMNALILQEKITEFKATNSTNFTNIFSTLFNAFTSVSGSSVIKSKKFGYQLTQDLIKIRDKYETDTTGAVNPEKETIVDILFSDLTIAGESLSQPPERARFRSLGNLMPSSTSLPDTATLKFSITSSGDDLNQTSSAEYDATIKSFLTNRIATGDSGLTTIQEALNNYFNYHDNKNKINTYLCKVAGSDGVNNANSAASKIKKYIEDEEKEGGDFYITANSNQYYTATKNIIKEHNNLYKKNVDKYKTKNNELNNILKSNLYNNIFLYITIVVLILICLGLIYINNHKASLKTQYSVMLIAFLLLYYIIYTNIAINVTESFLSDCVYSSNEDKYLQQITNLHSKITSFLQLNIYNKEKDYDINNILDKEKIKYNGLAKSSSSKVNSLELVLNDEFINAVKSKELVKFLLLFTAICIVTYIVYTNTEDPTTTSIVFIILLIIIIAIYFYNINLMTRTNANAKYWNHKMIAK